MGKEVLGICPFIYLRAATLVKMRMMTAEFAVLDRALWMKVRNSMLHIKVHRWEWFKRAKTRDIDLYEDVI